IANRDLRCEAHGVAVPSGARARVAFASMIESIRHATDRDGFDAALAQAVRTRRRSQVRRGAGLPPQEASVAGPRLFDAHRLTASPATDWVRLPRGRVK